MTRPAPEAAVVTQAAPELLRPAWHIPGNVACCFTTRRGGASAPPYDGCNLAQHVGDDPRAVVRNRAALRRQLGLAREPCWLEQVHGTTVHRAMEYAHSVTTSGDAAIEADAVITDVPGLACVVMVADCVPVLLCDDAGGEVAAVHAGWRGLRDGIIAATVMSFAAEPARLSACIGPHISLPAYAVGHGLREEFAAFAAADGCFVESGGRLHFDLGRACAQALTATGVIDVTRLDDCVHGDPSRWYSYRRDGVTGRQAALIWINDDPHGADSA